MRDDGTLKIIDLGFGKRVDSSQDFDKSISLNWWCEPPKDFESSTYDHSTEVYLVGKLFEKLILELGIEHFKFSTLLSRMCERDPDRRIPTFFDVRTQVHLNQSDDLDFSDEEPRGVHRLRTTVHQTTYATRDRDEVPLKILSKCEHNLNQSTEVAC